MKSAKFRPTFSFPTELTAREVVQIVKTEILKLPDEYAGQFANEYAIIGTTGKNRHFWSPWLQIEVRQYEHSREVFGRFTPHPNVWTGIVFLYLVLACCVFFGMMIAMSQQMAGESPWAYLTLPICGIIALVVWLVAQTGQRLAEDEMRKLQQRIEQWVKQVNRGD